MMIKATYALIAFKINSDNSKILLLINRNKIALRKENSMPDDDE